MKDTFSHVLIESLEERWKEVEALISLAESVEVDSSQYSGLCRATVVLMVAQFEGFIKQCVKSVIDDASAFSDFGDLPETMQRTYCSRIVRSNDEKPDSKNLDSRTRRLMEILKKSRISMEYEYFLEANRFENYQSNPNPELIDRICSNFGVKNFFPRLENSQLDVFFKDDVTAVKSLIIEVQNHILLGVKAYPFSVNPEQFGISSAITKSANTGKSRTFWQTFLDEIHRQRNAVAHGTSSSNEASLDGLKKNKDKLVIMQCVIMMIICESSINKSMSVD